MDHNKVRLGEVMHSGNKENREIPMDESSLKMKTPNLEVHNRKLELNRHMVGHHLHQEPMSPQRE